MSREADRYNDANERQLPSLCPLQPDRQDTAQNQPLAAHEGLTWSDFCTFGQRQGVIDVDPKIADRVLDLAVA